MTEEANLRDGGKRLLNKGNPPKGIETTSKTGKVVSFRVLKKFKADPTVRAKKGRINL